MSSNDDDPATKYGCATLLDHDGSRVWIAIGVHASYAGFDEQKRERLMRVMRNWCEEIALTKAMFNGNEGRSVEGTMLKALKTFKHRLYGFERRVEGVRTFIIIDYDPAKKQDKGDPKILKRAKARVDAFGKEK